MSASLRRVITEPAAVRMNFKPCSKCKGFLRDVQGVPAPTLEG
jgi:hypothetical protein